MTVESNVEAHYRHGNLEAAILAGLVAAGKNPDHFSPHDLMGADEFHIGGAEATRDLAARLNLHPGMHLLDIGSGLGGPARHLAASGCMVTGIDLSAEYVAVATSLTRRMGLAEQVTFHQASGNHLPFDPGSFDGVTLLHVGMNIADKPAAFAAIHRVLKPGGFFAVYDVMQTEAGTLDFPVPWSSVSDTSFVESPDSYRAALAAAGFTIASERNKAEAAIAFFAAMGARMAQATPPPLSLGIVMGPTGQQKVANMSGMIQRGLIAPVEMIARR